MLALTITLSIIGALVVAFLAYLLIKTLLVKKIETPTPGSVEHPKLDTRKIVAHMQESIQIPTVSMVHDYTEIFQPFIDYQDFLQTAYPTLHQKAKRTIVSDYSLVYHIKSKNSDKLPVAFLAHQDVVPASEDGWVFPPFSGHMSNDGYIYGRGAQDMKSHMIALLEAVEYLLNTGVTFNRDIYLCFGHDEEPPDSFNGAPKIVEYFKKKGVRFEFVLDEGGTTMDGNLLGIPATLALIGVTEKGMGNFEIITRKHGGHASNPDKANAVTILSKDINKINNHPMSPIFTNGTKLMFKYISPYMKFPFRLAVTNFKVFSPVLKLVLTKANPATNALVRTTITPTMLVGADATNVIPGEARANFNVRILTGQTDEDVLKHMQKRISKESQIRVVSYSAPSPESACDTVAYNQITKSICESFDNIITAPYMFIAATDSRHFCPVADNVYRFGPFIFGPDDQTRVHGTNERIHKDALLQATHFFIRVFKNSCMDEQ